MCVDDDSYPPIRPIAGGSAGSRDFRLVSADGTRFMAHAARASAPTGAGMVVIPDVRGLHPYYKELADRFAEVGVDAVAIDFFARTAPSDDRSESFDFMSQVPLTKPETLQADIAAGAGYLRGTEGGGVRSLFSVGFCFGGADEGIPQSDVDAFDAACRKAGVKHDLTVYPGAPHSFFDRKYTEFAEASADAWRRVQEFVRQYTKG